MPGCAAAFKQETKAKLPDKKIITLANKVVFVCAAPLSLGSASPPARHSRRGGWAVTSHLKISSTLFETGIGRQGAGGSVAQHANRLEFVRHLARSHATQHTSSYSKCTRRTKPKPKNKGCSPQNKCGIERVPRAARGSEHLCCRDKGGGELARHFIQELTGAVGVSTANHGTKPRKVDATPCVVSYQDSQLSSQPPR